MTLLWIKGFLIFILMSYNICSGNTQPFDEFQNKILKLNNVDSNHMDLIRTLREIFVDNYDENLDTWKIILMLFISSNQDQININKLYSILSKDNVFRNPILKRDKYIFHNKGKNILKQKLHADSLSDEYDRSDDDDILKRSKGKQSPDNRNSGARIAYKNRSGVLNLMKCEKGREYCINACKEAYSETCSKESCKNIYDKKHLSYCRRECMKQFTSMPT